LQQAQLKLAVRTELEPGGLQIDRRIALLVVKLYQRCRAAPDEG